MILTHKRLYSRILLYKETKSKFYRIHSIMGTIAGQITKTGTMEVISGNKLVCRNTDGGFYYVYIKGDKLL